MLSVHLSILAGYEISVQIATGGTTVHYAQTVNLVNIQSRPIEVVDWLPSKE